MSTENIISISSNNESIADAHMKITLRELTLKDKEDIKYVCNHIDKSYLSDRIPDPYTDADAEWWLRMVQENEGKNRCLVWHLC